jgi:excinuclease UvrABC nuclease subunit
LQTNVGRLLIALRDYAHHFAISYHRLKRKKSLQQ